MKTKNLQKIVDSTPPEVHDRVVKWMDKQDEMSEADELLLAVYREIWKDTVFQKCSHGLVENITTYLEKYGYIESHKEIQ